MKIQISPIKIIDDALVVWNEHGPEVDIVMDLKNLGFKEGSIDTIYSFHVLDRFFEHEVLEALLNWRKCLKLNTSLFVVVDDFEYIARGLVGGDITVDKINDEFSHPMHFSRDNLISYLSKAGFKEENQKIWNVSNIFPKRVFELVIEAQKHGQ